MQTILKIDPTDNLIVALQDLRQRAAGSLER